MPNDLAQPVQGFLCSRVRFLLLSQIIKGLGKTKIVRTLPAAVKVNVGDDSLRGPVDHGRVGLAAVEIEELVAMQGEDQVMFKVIDGRAMRTKVEVGQRRDGKVEIVEGIGANDTIVVAGWQRLRDGAAVRPAGGGGSGGGGGGGASKGGGSDATKGAGAGSKAPDAAGGTPRKGPPDEKKS